MTEIPEKDIDAIFEEGTPIDRALARAVWKAVRQHKLLGNPIAVWQDDRVVCLQPDEIELPEMPPE